MAFNTNYCYNYNLIQLIKPSNKMESLKETDSINLLKETDSVNLLKETDSINQLKETDSIKNSHPLAQSFDSSNENNLKNATYLLDDIEGFTDIKELIKKRKFK